MMVGMGGWGYQATSMEDSIISPFEHLVFEAFCFCGGGGGIYLIFKCT